MILEWFIGFHAPAFRNYLGAIYPMGWFGHVEAWGYTIDDTWMFFDPQGTGTRIVITHHHDDVLDQLAARHSLCDTILRVQNTARPLFPLYPPMTCATIVGHMIGQRAFTPSGLKRKLLANGAEIVHENAEGRSSRQGGETAGTPDLRTRTLDGDRETGGWPRL